MESLGLGSGVSGFGSRVEGPWCGVSDFGFRVYIQRGESLRFGKGWFRVCKGVEGLGITHRRERVLDLGFT